MVEQTKNIGYEGIGRRIRTARKAKGYTQEYVANRVDISYSYMSLIENGSSKLALPTLINIAKALDTTVDSLLYDEPVTVDTDFIDNVKIICSSCSEKEKAFMLAMLKNLKENLKKAIIYKPKEIVLTTASELVQL